MFFKDANASAAKGLETSRCPPLPSGEKNAGRHSPNQLHIKSTSIYSFRGKWIKFSKFSTKNKVGIHVLHYAHVIYSIMCSTGALGLRDLPESVFSAFEQRFINVRRVSSLPNPAKIPFPGYLSLAGKSSAIGGDVNVSGPAAIFGPRKNSMARNFRLRRVELRKTPSKNTQIKIISNIYKKKFTINTISFPLNESPLLVPIHTYIHTHSRRKSNS